MSELNPSDKQDKRIQTTPESVQDHSGILSRSLEKIQKIYKEIKASLDLGEEEAVATTDEILVETAETNETIDDTETALVEGSLEVVGEVKSSGPNPIDSLENDGYDELVTEAVKDLSEQAVVLPSGEPVAEVIVERIEDQESLKLAEYIEKLEKEHFCFEAPKLDDQIAEGGRQNLVTYISNQLIALHTGTSMPGYKPYRVSITEHDSLVAFKEFLQLAKADKVSSVAYFEWAQEVLKKLTFIGEKEYQLAAETIAELLKSRLRNNPDLLVYTVVGEIDSQMIKSDSWLLENILSKFSDAELKEFGDRIITQGSEIPDGTLPQNLQVILLDDWSISGMQIRQAIGGIAEKLSPEYLSCIEIQLIAASKKHIKEGARVFDRSGTQYPIPVRAVYRAHEASLATYGARITGYHSSVDFDFENTVDDIALGLIEGYRGERQITMPPLTNIVRPYRTKGVKLHQVNRVRKFAHR